MDDLTYDAEYVRGLLDVAGGEFPRVTVFELKPGETAWNPASTKHGIIAHTNEVTDLIYTEHQDGGFDVDVLRY